MKSEASNEYLNDYINDSLSRFLPKTSGLSHWLDQDYFTPDSFISFYCHPQNHMETYHSNDFIDIIFVLGGICRVQFPNSSEKGMVHELTLASSAICIITPNTPYRIQSSKDCSILHILYKTEDFKTGLSTLISANNTLLSFLTRAMYGQKEATYIAFFLNLSQDIRKLLVNLLHEMREQMPFYLNNIYYLLGILFCLSERERIGPLLLPPSQKYNLHQYETIYAYMNDNYATTNVHDIANTFHLSQSYLTKLFKRHTNQTVSEILQKIRLQSACNFLKHSDLTVQEISEIVGYGDVTHFIRLFKRTYGYTPLQFRKRKEKSSNEFSST